MTARDIITNARTKIEASPDQARELNATYKLVLEGAEGGTWIVRLRDQPTVTEGDGDAECTLAMSASDFVDLVEGRADGQQLFFEQKLRVEGDLGLAMKFQSLLQLIR